MSQTGQQPDARAWLLQAQWLIVVPAFPRRFISCGVEMNAVREPCPRIEPAALLEIVERPAAMHLLAEFVLVLGLRQMGMQANVEPRGERCGRAHQRCRHRKRRARRQRNLHHGVLAALMMPRYDVFAVGEDGVFVLHDAIRRQSTVALRTVHGAARQQYPDPESSCDRDFDVDGVLQPGRKNVMMIGRGGAAGQQQFRHRHGDPEIRAIPASAAPTPDRAPAATEIARGPTPPAVPGSASDRNDGAY